MLLHYLKIALRQMLKYKVHQLISALCLAVGIVCFSYVWLFVSMTEETYNLPDMDRRVAVYARKADGRSGAYSPNEILRLQEELKPLGVEGVSANTYARDGEVEVIDDEGRVTPYLVKYGLVNAYHFTYWNNPVQGLAEGELKPDDVVISAAFARKAFGQENPVGRWIRLLGTDGEGDMYRVAGVAEKNALEFQRADCFFSLMRRPDERNFQKVNTLIPPQMSEQDFQEYLERMWQGRENSLPPFLMMENAEEAQRHLAETLVLVIASLVLVSGLINFLKFIFQVFFIRQRELVLRKCMGSGLRGLYMLLASEVFLMLTLSFFLSLVVSEIILTLIDGRLPAEYLTLPMGDAYLVQAGVYAGTLAVGLLAACFPVMRLRRGTLHGFLQSARRKHTLRNWMIGLQLFISMFFVGGILLINMLWNETVFSGYMPLTPAEQDRVVVLPLNTHTMLKNKGPILDEVRRLPEVEKVLSFGLPGRLSRTTFMDYMGKDSTRMEVFMQSGHPGYFDFFHIPMEGKVVDPGAGNMVYVSRRFKQLLDEEGNDGTVRLSGVDYQIAGVYEALFDEAEKPVDDYYFVGSVFLPSPGVSNYFIRVNEHTGGKAFAERLTTLCRKHIPETLPLDIHLLTDDDETKDNIGLMRSGLLILVVISLLLVVLSIYSSISLDTLERQKEVAIRKINGAKPADIFLLFARMYLVIFAVTYVMACALIFIIGIQTFEYDTRIESVRSWQWPTLLFVLMAALLAVVTGWKIRQVMRLNPAEVIKTE